MRQEEIVVQVRIEDGVVTLIEKGEGVRVIIDDIDTEGETGQITSIYPAACVVKNGEEIKGGRIVREGEPKP